jgi:hypothetical protein
MGDKTGIGWTDHSFNPWWGCARISPGWVNCYADRDAQRYGHDLWHLHGPRRMLSDNTWNNPVRWNAAAEIRAMLAELPDQYRKSGGGGWSFLNACDDRHGTQWTGFHRTMEHLFMLGLAIGAVTLLMPRELWDALPGGMPYYMVDVDDEPSPPEGSHG